MEERLVQNAKKLPLEIHWICGGESYILHDYAFRIKNKLDEMENVDITTSVSVIPTGDHTLNATNAAEFNELVNAILNKI